LFALFPGPGKKALFCEKSGFLEPWGAFEGPLAPSPAAPADTLLKYMACVGRFRGGGLVRTHKTGGEIFRNYSDLDIASLTGKE